MTENGRHGKRRPLDAAHRPLSPTPPILSFLYRIIEEAVIRVKLDIVVTLPKVSRVKSTRCCDSRVGKALFVTERHGVCS